MWRAGALVREEPAASGDAARRLGAAPLGVAVLYDDPRPGCLALYWAAVVSCLFHTLYPMLCAVLFVYLPQTSRVDASTLYAFLFSIKYEAMRCCLSRPWRQGGSIRMGPSSRHLPFDGEVWVGQGEEVFHAGTCAVVPLTTPTHLLAHRACWLGRWSAGGVDSPFRPLPGADSRGRPLKKDVGASRVPPPPPAPHSRGAEDDGQTLCVRSRSPPPGPSPVSTATATATTTATVPPPPPNAATAVTEGPAAWSPKGVCLQAARLHSGQCRLPLLGVSLPSLLLPRELAIQPRLRLNWLPPRQRRIAGPVRIAADREPPALD